MAIYANHHVLPPPLDAPYDHTMRTAPSDLYRGTILTITNTGFIMTDLNGAGTTTVVVSRHTRLPYGDAFKVGADVVVVGDRTGTSTIDAFGVRGIE